MLVSSQRHFPKRQLLKGIFPRGKFQNVQFPRRQLFQLCPSRSAQSPIMLWPQRLVPYHTIAAALSPLSCYSHSAWLPVLPSRSAQSPIMLQPQRLVPYHAIAAALSPLSYYIRSAQSRIMLQPQRLVPYHTIAAALSPLSYYSRSAQSPIMLQPQRLASCPFQSQRQALCTASEGQNLTFGNLPLGNLPLCKCPWENTGCPTKHDSWYKQFRMSSSIRKTIIKILFRSHIIVSLISKLNILEQKIF